MSGKGDGSSISSVDLSLRDFRDMMYYAYGQGKSLQECHYFQVVQTVYVCLERERWKSMTVVVELQRPLHQKTSLG